MPMSAESRVRERASCRRPIHDDEIPHLEAMGDELRRMRLEAGLSWETVAHLASVNWLTVYRLESGVRRTRRPMLERLVVAILSTVDDDVTAAEVADVVDHLIDLVGPALAGPSMYAGKVADRRVRRDKKAAKLSEKQWSEAVRIAKTMASTAISEYQSTGRLPRWVRK